MLNYNIISLIKKKYQIFLLVGDIDIRIRSIIQRDISFPIITEIETINDYVKVYSYVFEKCNWLYDKMMYELYVLLLLRLKIINPDNFDKQTDRYMKCFAALFRSMYVVSKRYNISSNLIPFFKITWDEEYIKKRVVEIAINR